MDIRAQMQSLLAAHVEALGATLTCERQLLTGMWATTLTLAGGQAFVVELPEDATETDVMFGARLLLKQARGTVACTSLPGVGNRRVDQPASGAPVQGPGALDRPRDRKRAGRQVKVAPLGE
jgi:hypothetical protein